MSKIFHLVCFPPSVGHWSKWALSCGTKGKARNTAIALFLITKKSKLPMIPRDVWNIVVWHVYAHTLQKVEMDVESWLKLWVTNPIQQRYNPLYTNHDVIDDWRMFRHQKFPPIVGHFQKQEVSLRISDTAWVYYTSQVRGGLVSTLLGICVSDVSNIESCTYIVGSQETANFIFDDQHTAVVIHDLKEVRFYYNPKIIHSLSEYGQGISCRINVKRPVKGFPQFCWVYAVKRRETQSYPFEGMRRTVT